MPGELKASTASGLPTGAAHAGDQTPAKAAADRLPGTAKFRQAWTRETLLAFIRHTPAGPSVEYIRPFAAENPEYNQRLCQTAEWTILSMANLQGGLIFIGVEEKRPGRKLAGSKASLAKLWLTQIHKQLAAEARPDKPRVKVHAITLNPHRDPETVYVLEVAKSTETHYLVTPEGLFYPIKSGTDISRLEIIAAQHKDIAIDTDLNEFITFISDYVLPMLPGSFLAKSVLSNPSQDIASLDEEQHRILVKPNRNYRLRLVISRPHLFSQEDKDIVKSIIQEAYNIENIVAPEYKAAMRTVAIEVALCKYIAPRHYMTVLQIIEGLTAWSIRTYEGRTPTFGIKVNFQELEPSPDGEAIGEIISEDYFAVLSDGRNTLIETNAHGQVSGHRSTHGKRINHGVLAPLQYAKMANEASAEQAVLVLTQHSELLIFIDRELKFAKRRGVWLHFNHAPIIRLIAAGSKYVGEALRKAVYETLLDISFAKTGGTLCICRKTSLRRLIEDRGISGADIFGHEEQSLKSRFLEQIVQKRKFQDIPRGLRQELLSIDGAVIVDHEGRLICIGAIVKVRSGSPAGGRLAATQALSKYGPAFKVSSDGMISAYLFKDHRKSHNPPDQKPIGPDSAKQAGALSRIETLFTIA